MKKYSKVSELSFKIEEEKHVEDTIQVYQQLGELAKVINTMKGYVVNAKKYQDAFIQCVEWYNDRCDMFATAKKELKMEFTVPEKIEICKDFNILDVDIEKLPRIDIKGDGSDKNESIRQAIPEKNESK